MLERDVIRKIRTEMLSRFGVRLHKIHGSVYSELSASDLYGTLPGGRACYFEVKLPGKKARPEQLRWLEEEKKLGAVAEVVTSWEELRDVLVDEGFSLIPRGDVNDTRGKE